MKHWSDKELSCCGVDELWEGQEPTAKHTHSHEYLNNVLLACVKMEIKVLQYVLEFFVFCLLKAIPTIETLERGALGE